MLYGSDFLWNFFSGTKNNAQGKKTEKHPFDSFINSGDYEISQ